MKKKRFLSGLLALVMVLAMLPGEAGALESDKIVTYPATGGNIYFDTETGKIYDCDSSVTEVDIPSIIAGMGVIGIGEWAFSDCSNLTRVSIPNSVTSIELGAFYCCGGLTSVTIPNSVTSIGMGAFEHCSGLTHITIPNSVTSIEMQAFWDCIGLTSVTLSDSITSIEAGTFYDCRNLASVIIPDGVASIGKCAFYGCISLTSVTIPDSVTSIGVGAFNGCRSLTSVTIPDSVTSIGNEAFWNCENLSGITIPNSVISIGDGAFNSCRSLTSITIPNSVISIGDGAFNNCRSLTSITIPNSVASIGDGAFNNCNSLSSITVDPENLHYTAESGVLFNKQKDTLVCYPQGKSGSSYVISDGVTIIETYAFNGCSSLTGITIPNSVTSIGDEAFFYCSGLTDVYYGGNESQWEGITIGINNYPLTSATIHYDTVPSKPNDPDPCIHQWSEYEVTVPAVNCLQLGTRIRTCSKCGETEEEHFQGPHRAYNTASSCAEATICSDCWQIMRSAGQHDLTYTANGAVITETCTFDCGHIATATITAGDAYYTGKEIKTADVVKDPEWEGGELEIAYTKNVNIGTATASITAGGATASVNFKVMSKINLKNYKGTVSTFYTMEKSWSFNDKLKDQNKDDIVYSLTQASLANADEDTAKAIRAQLYNLLFVSSFSPTTFGNSTEEIKKWHPQNIDNSATKLTGRAEDTGLKSIGVAPIQWDFGAKGCYSYALYAEKYVYGTNGKKVSIGQTPSAEQIVESFHQYLDPGEAIRYEKPIYIGGKSYTTGHALLFLGESIDEKGFYFVSYGGGASDEGTSHTMSAGYFSYTDFANVLRTNNYRLFLFDANNGSYLTKASKVGLNPETKSGQIKMNCPVEAVVSLNNETLDSRRLNSGETASTSFGTMSVSGPVGGDREILVCFNEGYIDTDGLEFTVIGTDRGTMDITITYIYTEPEIDSAEKTDTRIFENIPITADTVITTSRLAEKNTTELYVTSAGTDSAEIWDANNGETVVAPTSYTAQDDPVVEPNASGNPDIPIYPVSPAPSTPASIRKENTDVPEATAEPETPDAAETPQPPAAMSFADVPASAWYYNAVQYVYEKGIMNGTAAALFSPDASTTRGMIVTILYRLEGEPAAGGSAFTDVPAGQWYTSAVGWAAANGIVDGYGDGRFGPGDTVTREQLAAILYRYTAFKGGDTSARADVGAYRDRAEISPYALEAICWAAAEGVINGFDDGRLAPRESASRAQVAQMLMNYLPQ